MVIKVQPEVYSILIILVILCSLMIYMGHCIKKTDPSEKPTGFAILGILLVTTIDNLTAENMGKQFKQHFGPYPHLPKEWESCELNFVYRGSEIKIKAEQDKTEFILLTGNAVEFEYCGKIYTLSDRLTIN